MVDTRQVESRAATRLRRQRLFDLDFVDAADERQVLFEVLAGGFDDDGRAPVVVTPNVDHLVRLQRAPADVRNVLYLARWCLPDGQPVVWTSRLAARPLTTRLTGSSLVEAFWSEDRSRIPFAVVASTSVVAAHIEIGQPGACIVVAPRLEDRDAVDEFVASQIDAIVACEPKLIFVGIGFPKDHHVIAALLASWPRDREVPVMLAIGGSFEMLFGIRQRAPQWVQRVGFEWLFRFSQEPRRLFVRYFVRDPAFLALALTEVRRSRAERRRGVAAR